MGAEGQDLPLAKNEVLKQIFVHLPFKTLPKGRHEVAPGRLWVAGDHGHGTVDLKDRKGGQLHQEASDSAGSGRRPRGKGSRNL